MPYSDGTYTSAVQNGPKQTFYPFINAAVKDNVTKGTIRNYVVLPNSYTPLAALSTDPDDSTQYLINESDLVIESGIARFQRTYCKVPTDQVDYTSLVITKPAFPSSSYNNCYIDSTSSTATANVFSTIISATISSTVTGGTFTITYKTSTTAALAYNASDATIAGAVNGLASVITDGLTFSASNQLTTAGTWQLTIQRTAGIGYDNTNMSWTPSLTPTATVSTSRLTDFVYFKAWRSTWNVLKTGYGLANNSLVIINPTTVYQKQAITVIDSDNFTVDAPSSVATGTGPNGYRYFLRTYTPGTDRVLSKNIDKFYLPGVTGGISSGADIPVPDVAINDVQLLNLITGSATGFQNYDAEPVTSWPTSLSPIYRQRLIQINVDNL